MSAVKIEKGIPMPPKLTAVRGNNPAGGKCIYPWTTMPLGTSFQFRDGVALGSARCLASTAGKKYGGKFSVRKMPDGRLRCWRVS